jgi:formylglycine-generating enzyme required for sulfatase activity
MKRYLAFGLFVFLILTLGFASAQESVTLEILIDVDSFTVYLPGPGNVSLSGLVFSVTDSNSVTRNYGLEDYASFRGLPYNAVPTPICFRVVRSDSNAPAPQDCQGAMLLTQRLAPADVFWYDSASEVSLLVIVTLGELPSVLCPSGNSRCSVNFTSPTGQATETVTSGKTPREVAEQGVTQNADWGPYVEASEGLDMVLVPAGSFTMGSTEAQIDAAFQGCQTATGGQCDRSWFEGEGPQTQITFSEPFWISQREVTNAQYKECVDAGVCTPPGERASYDNPDFAEHPVVHISWSQANDYATWLGMRLPTEVEWEYAARGPDGLVYPWGNTFDGRNLNFCDANCAVDWRNPNVDDGFGQTAPVGSYPEGVSWVGALDMSGNVWEWQNSIFRNYPYSEGDGREGTANPGEVHVLRGGSWYTYQTDNRTITRLYFAGEHDQDVGFRVAMDYSPAP